MLDKQSAERRAEHHSAIQAAMDDFNARRVRTEHVGKNEYRNESILDWYVFSGGVLIVQYYESKKRYDGFEIYVPASTSGKVSDVIDAVKAYCEKVKVNQAA